MSKRNHHTIVVYDNSIESEHAPTRACGDGTIFSEAPSSSNRLETEGSRTETSDAFAAQVNQYIAEESSGSFPKLGVPFWGVPVLRTITFGCLYWGPPYLGQLPSTSRYASTSTVPQAFQQELPPRLNPEFGWPAKIMDLATASSKGTAALVIRLHGLTQDAQDVQDVGQVS